MNTEIIVALISLVGVIVSVFATSNATQKKIDTENSIQSQKIDQLAIDIKTVKDELTDKLINQRELEDTKVDTISKTLEVVKSDIKEHNNYAKLFTESVPVIKEQIKVINHRLDDVEGELKDLRK